MRALANRGLMGDPHTYRLIRPRKWYTVTLFRAVDLRPSAVGHNVLADPYTKPKEYCAAARYGYLRRPSF